MPALVALPDIALAAAAMVLVILGWAIYALRDFLVSGFSHLPGVGGWIGSHLGGWLTAAGNAVTHASASAFGGAEGVFKTVESWSVWVWHVMHGIANDVGDTLWHIATVQVPRAYHLAVAESVRLFDQARHETAVGFDALRHDMAAWGDRVAALSLTYYHEALKFADRRATQTEVSVGQRIGVITTDLHTWGDQAVAHTWEGIDGDVQALRRMLGKDMRSWQHLLPLLEGAAGAGLIGALTRALAGSALAVKAVEQCVVPNCDNLGKFGKDIAELGSAGSAAAMLAWLAYVAADPVAAADDTVTVAGPLTDAVFGPLVSLVSAATEHL